ncbi:CcmD family protein [Belliella kenyensis]|uniref:CcmD family protein n=1 Tax=Belliella kenyensis TaxID=1472724 RepID=A0ABV8EIQ5_9BACT|nr:CcmD family protein [Belliella kenyensis]MCH7401344.1 CcmD family protein [Belliella kenyensis]MDN3602787.1 CcmD family protein [Belliella kenyensis]
MKKLIVILFFLVSLQGMAQEKIAITEEDYQNSSIEMADVMRSEGKIYVLVGIIGIVFGGILVYIISTDRKIARLEKLVQEGK